MTEVEFYFDVMCPWAYQTSVWIREAEKQRDLHVTWRLFSLEEVNREEGKKHPWERPWSYGWSMLRVAAVLRRRGNDDVGRFYEAAGRALHVEGRRVQERDTLEAVMREAGLDVGAVEESVRDRSVDDEVRADHQRVVDLGGYGVPTMVLDGTTPLFGPVVAPAPTGEAAGRLWDLVAGWAEYPHLYELRRPKTPADWEHIEGLFSPYLQARDWRSVQNPVA
ncbi:DsbA family protein [Acidiferrimicrobium sp. IK]|uniref:DsbA family protein n=1 Tax=Acidiferrimicrobium sp. IK TaxID=2871700 RepID=UPI0021CAF883|nr:DsbA family protein [Acidiferrimicrobium sp. IK]MCU4182791.1 DsbA family protein [Acidiferrimicrobium sp. IK]